MDEIKGQWYYKPECKWFDNRKEAKLYLGNSVFDYALKRKDIIYYKDLKN